MKYLVSPLAYHTLYKYKLI